MRPILQIVSLLALIALTLPSLLFLAGRLELNTVHWVMLPATLVWFCAATPWMWRETRSPEAGQDDASA